MDSGITLIVIELVMSQLSWWHLAPIPCESVFSATNQAFFPASWLLTVKDHIFSSVMTLLSVCILTSCISWLCSSKAVSCRKHVSFNRKQNLFLLQLKSTADQSRAFGGFTNSSRIEVFVTPESVQLILHHVTALYYSVICISLTVLITLLAFLVMEI